MRKNYVLAILTSMLLSFSLSAQVSYTGNGNTGFGNPVGNATLEIDDDGTTITCTFTKGSNDLNDMIVMYIASGATGRSLINGDVNDQNDDSRKAISNIGSGDLTFPSGFQATHAIAINTSFGGLWSIPNSGTIGNNGLPFITAVGNPAATTTASFSFSFTWDNLGLERSDNFQFVITYGNPTSNGGTEMFSADEAFGGGIGSGNPGTSAMTFTSGHSYPNTWTGDTDNDWATAGNWSEGVPSTTDNVHIPAGLTNYPTASGAVTINQASISSGASLIAQSTFAGTITYARNLSTTNWYLVGSPVSGETIEELISNNSFDTGTPPNIGLAPYNNSQAAAADRWDYQTAVTSGLLTSGGGYSVKLASAGNLTFIGSMEVADVGVSITDGTGSGGNAFNLVGNPYPSFLAANSNADGTNNLLTINTASLTENTLWLWNESTSSYDQFNQASAAFHIAPGQGFFVSSTGSNTFNFTEAMQSHQGTDTFQRSTNDRPEIILVMTDGTLTRDTDIYYIDGTSTGFDNGFDSSIFSGIPTEFIIYTQAVANGNGRDLGIQSLPDNDFENMIIPVGIKATSGKNITISASAFNLPTGINVYLEDKNDGSFTLLDSSSDFTTTLDSDLNGIGRFFLHTSSQALSVDEINLNNISMYTANNNLRVVGVQNGTAQVRMYNILGKQVMTSSFEGTGADDITLPNLRAGVYIVQLETETGKLNKKVIIE
jgi:hypothetical protein